MENSLDFKGFIMQEGTKGLNKLFTNLRKSAPNFRPLKTNWFSWKALWF